MSRIEYIKHNEINFTKWDNTILSSKIPFVFAQSFYLNATCPYWDALVLNDYESVFPLTQKHKFGFNYLPQPPFTSQLGVYGNVNLEIEQLFYNYITEHFKLIEIELNVINKLQTNYISPKNTYVINYNVGYKFNQNTKRNIAKATSNNIYIQQVENKNILSLSQKYINPFLETDVKLSKSTISLLDNLLNNAIDNGTLYSFIAIDKYNTIKAMAHFISNGNHTLYLKGTNVNKLDHSGSMHLLMKHAIEFFAEKSVFFDFGGGSNEGLANFYKGLGGQVMTYSFLKVNNLPGLIKIFKK